MSIPFEWVPSGPQALPAPIDDTRPEPWSPPGPPTPYELFQIPRPEPGVNTPLENPVRTAPAKPASGPPGTPCTMLVHGDAMLFGVANPGVGRLPITLDAPVTVEIEGVTVELTPCVSPAGYFPKRIAARVLEALPKSSEAVVERDHKLVRDAFAAELARAPKPSTKAPLAFYDYADTAFAALCEVARSYALPIELAATMLQPWSPFTADETKARLAAVYASGHCAPGTAGAALLAAEAERLEVERRSDAALARNAAQVTERIAYDLREQGWLEVRRTSVAPDPREDVVRRRLDMEVPTGSTYVRSALLFDGRLLPGVEVHSRGQVLMTRAEASRVAPASGALSKAIRDAREMSIEPHAYSESDFTGDARTLEGKAAFEQFATWAKRLVSPDPGLAFWTLPVAFGGRIDLENAAHLLGLAVDEQDARMRRPLRTTLLEGGYPKEPGVTRYDLGARSKTVEVPSTLTRSVPTAAQAPRLMLAALKSTRQVWHWGELYEPPTPADVARLTGVTLETATYDFARGKSEVRYAELTDYLRERGVLAGEATSPQQRDQIRAVLESLGFESKIVARAGERYRAWVRPAPAPSDALERLAEQSDAPAVTEALARLREEHPNTAAAVEAHDDTAEALEAEVTQ